MPTDATVPLMATHSCSAQYRSLQAWLFWATSSLIGTIRKNCESLRCRSPVRNEANLVLTGLFSLAFTPGNPMSHFHPLCCVDKRWLSVYTLWQRGKPCRRNNETQPNSDDRHEIGRAHV